MIRFHIFSILLAALLLAPSPAFASTVCPVFGGDRLPVILFIAFCVSGAVLLLAPSWKAGSLRPKLKGFVAAMALALALWNSHAAFKTVAMGMWDSEFPLTGEAVPLLACTDSWPVLYALGAALFFWLAWWPARALGPVPAFFRERAGIKFALIAAVFAVWGSAATHFHYLWLVDNHYVDYRLRDSFTAHGRVDTRVFRHKSPTSKVPDRVN